MRRMSTMERDVLRRVEQVCSLDLESRSLRTEVAGRLGRVIAYDAYCFATMDPLTLLLTDEVSEGVPPGGGSVATHNEYLVDDVDKFADLARAQRLVGILGRSTGGEPDRSHRFRTVLPMIEAKDELRVVFLADRQCWGALSLFRGHNRPEFTLHDSALAKAVSRTVAVALRRAATRPGTATVMDPAGPGVLMLDRHGETMFSNEAAQRWLDELSSHRIALHEVAAASRAGRAGESYLRLCSRAGQWLALSGSVMNGGDQGSVSIVIQPAPSSDIMRMLTLVHALTPREQEVMQGVIAGTSNPAIAAGMRISPHTVQSHLKSLFAKTGVSSRGQLVAQVVGENYGL